MTDRIILEGMTFYGHHGALSSERELGQRFVVDVEVFADLSRAGLSDDLSETIDYGEVHRRAREIAEGEPVNLTETVAERIAASVLGISPGIESVCVRVSKPEVRLEDTVLKGAAVEILRRKGSQRGDDTG